MYSVTCKDSIAFCNLLPLLQNNNLNQRYESASYWFLSASLAMKMLFSKGPHSAKTFEMKYGIRHGAILLEPDNNMNISLETN